MYGMLSWEARHDALSLPIIICLTSGNFVSIIFRMIVQNDLAPDCFTATYLTMGLLFLKVYASETIHAGIASVSEKTFRECSLIAVTAISDLYFLVVS